MESVRGIASLKALNLEERRRGVWVNFLVDRINADLRVQKLKVIFEAVSASLMGADRLIVIFLGVRWILADTTTVGMLVAFLAYKDQFATRIDRFITTLVQFIMLSMHGERIAEIALAKVEASNSTALALSLHAQANVASALMLQDVSFRYGDNEREILSHLSLAINAGECLGVAGPSGVGKTTLLKIIAGLNPPMDGKIIYDGTPISAPNMAAYRARIGCVLQDDQLFAGSIAENIASFDPHQDPAWRRHGGNP